MDLWSNNGKPLTFFNPPEKVGKMERTRQFFHFFHPWKKWKKLTFFFHISIFFLFFLPNWENGFFFHTLDKMWKMGKVDAFFPPLDKTEKLKVRAHIFHFLTPRKTGKKFGSFFSIFNFFHPWKKRTRFLRLFHFSTPGKNRNKLMCLFPYSIFPPPEESG